MSKSFSSKKPSPFPPPTPKAIGTSCTKKKKSPRSPLQDLNRISSSSNSSYASSNVSIEPPKGCLKFLSSSSFKTPVSRPRNLSKTPNSVPDAPSLKQSKSKSSRENLSKANLGLQTKRLTSDRVPRTVRKNPMCLYQWQSGKKSGSRVSQKSKPCSALNEHGKTLPTLPSSSEELKWKEDRLEGINDSSVEHSQLKSCPSDATMTPLSKKVSWSDLDSTVYGDVEENLNRSTSRTPPIHSSLSPEIQGGSLVSTTTPACYGAGYVVSGVTDKRKCRPRGILTVEDNYSGFDKMGASIFDDDNEKKFTGVNKNLSPSLLPSPSEALVLWLSSPRNKGKKVLNRKSEIVLGECQGLVESISLGYSASPTSSSKTFWNISDSSDLSGAANGAGRKTSPSISPTGLSQCQAPFGSILSPSFPSILFSPNSTPNCSQHSSEKEKNDHHHLMDGNSPFSRNSLGSGNIIQTPQSDSSSDLHIGLSSVHADNQKEDNFNSDLTSLTDVLLSQDFLLNSSAQLEDSVHSSFQFDCSTVPYEPIDLRKLPNFSDDHDPWLSSSTIENVSQSRMRISWREGLMSQYEEDEFDCCRCLSDEEVLSNECCNKLSDPEVDVEDGNKNSDVGIVETLANKLGIYGPDKEVFPALLSSSCAESISTDGGGLVASTEGSDWTSCYKNKIFEL
ncbi:hypothetical protein TanjilG_32121 [Lupinus angustifolius]|uniref:Uncharacterized protein n=1 Tax=Lupinus angustifolius TaxID=3871 RepID=A0A1J7HKE7_LUPAN|nr:PREDICTED: probable serine/threonine-protein kinase nek3 [Lupinus angustifolius]OIW13140.1 hypothetical protein TanjilG_32121 [Lupinus angustifolius]